MKITDIPVDPESDNSDDEKFETLRNKLDDGQLIYQFQPCETDNCAHIVTIGQTLKHSDILIHTLDISNNIKCRIVSCLYIDTELNKLQDVCIFPLVKLCVFDMSKTINQLESMYCYNFHTSVHQQNNTDIYSYSDQKVSNMNKLHGSFSITYHKDNKMSYLQKYNSALLKSDVINKLVEEFTNII